MASRKIFTCKGMEFCLIEVVSYSLVALLVTVLGYGIYAEHKSLRATALKQYIASSQLHTRDTADRVTEQFRQIYQGIRTLARLPAIRNIDRYGLSFEINARISAQEIYNNLAENVVLSEVYIVPVDFDPDHIDAKTGKPEEPIATLDHLIVGRNAEQSPQSKFRTAAEQPLARVELDEIEIYEYRLMRDQLRVLKNRFGQENKIKGLSYPAIAGKEVITCDNTRYSPSNPNDADRKGLVYSVPFYRQDGTLGGMISAVILTSILRDMLTGSSAAIEISQYDFIAGGRDSGIWVQHLEEVKAARPATDLLYSEIVDLPVADISGDWKIWAGRSNHLFWSRADVKGGEEEAILKLISLMIASLAFTFFLRTNFTRQRRAVAKSAELERLINERTQDLQIAQYKSEAANQAKSTFLANMSHDIRTPISGIIGLADILKKSELDVEDARKVTTIYQSGNILLDIINNVLDLSKIEAGHVDISPEIFSPHALIDQCVSMFSYQAQKKGLSIEFDVGDEIPRLVEGDFKHLRRVMINLLGNAIKFTDEGGVFVRISRSGNPPSNMIELLFEIEDSGIGISSSDLDSICEPFVREDQDDGRHFGGTGLGLSISRSLIEKMGGRLDFTSVKGKGTKFFFNIPFCLRPAASLRSDFYAKGRHISGPVTYDAQILIVEDNPVNMEIAKTYLERSGCQIEVASNGEEAIAIHSRMEFDLIFMDCKLPGMDGLDATKAIRKKEKCSARKPAPIVALTANAFREDRENCVRAGMNDFLSKPFSAKDLLGMLDKHLGPRAGAKGRAGVIRRSDHIEHI